MARKYAAQRKQLEAQKARLTHDVERARDTRQDSLPPPDEPSYSNHLADEGTLTYQQEENLAVERHLERELEAVESALARIADGSYGKCDNCGKPIAAERLEALPTASLCIDCKSRLAQRR